ncbi:hypothetical protein DERF_007557 [Dermatophagoides farinae]|uniref:Uncharacterized protein n=1 Tax=Dermatophagoides farinae TaxID=6954 RepID=A0A922L643_DERFA|nr:hypothetical protein DERF_007557 [Dermatophagoides farinae]
MFHNNNNNNNAHHHNVYRSRYIRAQFFFVYFIASLIGTIYSVRTFESLLMLKLTMMILWLCIVETFYGFTSSKGSKSIVKKYPNHEFEIH